MIAGIPLLCAAEDLIQDDGSILGSDLLEGADNVGKATALEQEPKNNLQVKFLAYNQSDSGGIEEIDEDASIFETVILYSRKIDEKNTFTARLLADVVSSASIKREHNASYRSLQSGASGTAYLNANLGWQHKIDNWTYKINGGFGSEYAYESMNIGLGALGELNDKNTNVSINLQHFSDTVRMIRFNGIEDADEDRDSNTVEIGLTQILTPRSLFNLVLHHSEQEGFLATQFNSVFVSGTEDYEILPDSRSRTSITGRYKHAVGNDAAWEAGLRFYTDDWGIDAETVDLRYFDYILDRSVLMEYQLRFYQQNEADYYQEAFTTAQEYQTSDPDLGDFTGTMFGIKATFKDRHIFGQEGDWDVGVNVYNRDNGLDMFWLTTGFKISF